MRDENARHGNMSPQERNATAALALGRILRLAARPEQPGDIAEYERCRAILLDVLEPQPDDYRPNYQRDRLRGAQGDI